jgi:4-amino-4-deoxy-L-arabinose transferase-like glycosyltransferase
MNNRPRSRSTSWLLLVVLFGFGIRFAAIDFQSLWRDEIDAAGFGSPEMRMGEVLAASDFQMLAQSLTQGGFNGPLYFIALQQWTRMAGDTAFALRFPSAVFGTLAVPLIYVLARRLLRRTPNDGISRRAALISAWLVAISPYFVWYSQEAKMYTEVTALAIAAIYALRRAVDTTESRRAWPWWALAVAATTLAMYSHILAALLIGVEVVLFLLWWPQSRRHWLGGLSALAALTLPYLPLIGWQLAYALTPGSQGFAFYRFDQILQVMLAAFANGVLPFDYSLSTIGAASDANSITPALSPALWGLWLLGLLAIAGAVTWRDNKDRNQRIGLAAWALIPMITIALVSLNRPIFTDRYLIWIGPAIYLLAALGIVEAGQWNRALGGAALVAITSVALVSTLAQSTTPYKADFRSAASYVEERYRGEIIVFQIPYGRYNFDYYFDPEFSFLDGLFTNHRNPDGTYQIDPVVADAHIAGLLEGIEPVWLVATEVEMWDDRHLLQEWLGRNGRVTDQADFMRVTVARYELGP